MSDRNVSDSESCFVVILRLC